VSSKDRSRTESQLIEAARRVFSQHGFNGSSTRMIAEDAGVNVSLISRYFGGKRGLLLALIQKEAMGLSKLTTDYPPQASLREECVSYAESYFDFLMANLVFVRIILLQSMTDTEFLEGFKQLNFSLVNKDVTERIEHFLDNEQSAPHEVTAVQVIGGVERLVLGTVCFQHLMAGQEQKECLLAIKESVIAMLTARN